MVLLMDFHTPIIHTIKAWAEPATFLPPFPSFLRALNFSAVLLVYMDAKIVVHYFISHLDQTLPVQNEWPAPQYKRF